MELNELRKIAEAVKQEPWVLSGGNEWISPIGITVDYDNGGVSSIEAEFIATFDPPTVLALLSRLEQAEQAVQRVRELAGEWIDIYEPCGETLIDALDGEPNE